MQRLKAIEIINSKGQRNIATRKCSIYGHGLARPLVLMLARQHNDFNGIQRFTTFSEVAASCRRLIFLHFGSGEDDGNYMPTIPYYNSDAYKKFKQECITYLSSPRLVSL